MPNMRNHWPALLFLLSAGIFVAPGRAASAPADATVNADVVQALKDLKTADSDGRQKIYTLLSDKGDASIIPALNAYKNGSLQLTDKGELAIYGDRVSLPDRGSVLPLIDALTTKPILGDDGQPIYAAKPDLSNAMRAPPRRERPTINDLITSLSLLDPDPAARLLSIRDVGERANRAFLDVADQQRMADQFTACSTALKGALASAAPDIAAAMQDAIAALDAAAAEKPADLLAAAPGSSGASKAKIALMELNSKLKDAGAMPQVVTLVGNTISLASSYGDRIDAQGKTLDELKNYSVALEKQLDKDPQSRFAPAITEALACIRVAIGDHAARLAAATTLGDLDTSRAANVLGKVVESAHRVGDSELEQVAQKSLDAAQRYQGRVRFVENTFAGLSLSSILILLALGLSIIFGLMGVINMAQGEFMMVGAFTTYVVSAFFKQHLPPGAYDYYLIAAVPAAFIVSGLLGYVVEYLVIRHLYGRPLDSLLATWGVGFILIAAVRKEFGDTLTVAPPKWMEGGVEVAADMTFPLNRVYIIVFCVICIALVYLLVNRTKLGLLLRATTQNRDMAAALGVPTRRVDGLTFAFGTGLAGLAGVVVPLYNKINPNIGQEYIVDSFMVVVTGGVGKLAGVIWAGLGLGFLNKYLEALLNYIPAVASGASVLGKVIVLLIIILFLQWRPSGLFPPRGRMADA
jgi:urea transport system permease protein